MAQYTLGNYILDTGQPRAEVLAAILKDDSINEELFYAANKVKTEQYGNLVFVRGIIEFSNYCRCLCAYCGINARMKDAVRYRMAPDELVEAAVDTAKVYRTVILQSGEECYYTCLLYTSIIAMVSPFSSVRSISFKTWVVPKLLFNFVTSSTLIISPKSCNSSCVFQFALKQAAQSR